MEHAYQLKTIPVTISGHYLMRAPQGEGPHGLLMGYHGYGENARHMMKSLEEIPGSENHILCSVQGVHQFYQRASGNVVASWMTWLGREKAIEVNLQYISDVMAEVEQEHPAKLGVVHLGFSQGAAMAFRCAFNLPVNCKGAVAFGGDMPPELTAPRHREMPPVLLGRGREDKIYSFDLWHQDAEVLRRKGAQVEEIETAGGHQWNEEFAAAAGKFIDRVFSGA